MLGVSLMLVAQNKCCSKGLHKAYLGSSCPCGLGPNDVFLGGHLPTKTSGGHQKGPSSFKPFFPSRSFSCFSGQTQQIGLLPILTTTEEEKKSTMEKEAGGGDKKQPQQPKCAQEALDLLNCVARNPYDQDKCLLLMQSLRECIVSKKVILFKLDDQDQGKANPGSNKTR